MKPGIIVRNAGHLFITLNCFSVCRLADLADFKAVNEIYAKCECHAFALLFQTFY